MSDSKGQQLFVFWGYVIQWLTILMPLALLVSLVYVVVVRGRVMNPALRSHIDWQLATCLVSLSILALALGLLIVGLSGVATDAQISVIATFALLALLSVAPFWLLYRLVRGTLRFRNKLPMEKLFP